MRVQETDWGYIEWMEPEYPGMGSEEASLRTGTVYVEPGKTMLRHVHYEGNMSTTLPFLFFIIPKYRLPYSAWRLRLPE